MFPVYVHVLTGSSGFPIDCTGEVHILREAVARRLGVTPARVTLYSFVNGVKVLLTDSWPCSKYSLQCNSVVLAGLGRHRDFAELPAFEHYVHKQLIEVSCRQACRRGMLDALERHFEYFEQMGSCDVSAETMCILDKPLVTGWTCMHFACQYGHRDIAEFLMQKGANVNAVSLDGWSPLLLAVQNQCLDTVALLLACQSLQLDQLSAVYGSALHLAARLGLDAVATMLMQHGASPMQRDGQGRLPIELVTRQSTAELLPKYMGQILLSRFQGRREGLFQIEEGDDEIPPPFCGYITYAEIPDRLVYLVLDISSGLLSRYTSRDHFLDQLSAESHIQLNDILELSHTHSLEDRKACLLVRHKSGRDKYFSLFQEVSKEWHSQIAYGLTIAHKLTVRSRRTLMTESAKSADSSPAKPTQSTRHTLSGAEEVLSELSRDQLDGDVMLRTFQILEQLGQGSFGQVFKVKKKDTDSLYALKVLSKLMLLKHNQLKYALSELKILKSLDFPFIVKLYSRFQTPKSLYLILEYCPNGDLAAQIQAKEVLSQEEACFYTAEILLALDFIHSKGIAYRDLKPENVLLDAEGHIRLTDFGLAKDGLTSSVVTKSFCGSPAYLAPEMLLKKGAGQPADIYGLGAVLYEMLTGKPPFFSDDISILFTNIKLGRLEFPWNITAEAKDLLRLLLAREPSSRPTTRQIMRHSFFKGVDWTAAMGKRLQPPAFVPREVYEEDDSVLRKAIKDRDYSERPTLEECLLDFD